MTGIWVVAVSRLAGAGEAIQKALPGAEVELFDSLGAVAKVAGKRPCEFLFVDLELLDPEGTELLGTAIGELLGSFPTARVVVLASSEDISRAIVAVRSGAANYLTFPLVPDEVQFVCESLNGEARLESELDHLKGRFWRPEFLELLKTESPAMRRVYGAVRQVAPTKATVLLLGETGTGKNVLAKLIHLHSKRSAGPFIQVHCGAIPAPLLESELFGHERGAFTGAVKRKLGRFEIADGGTILLDEIATMPPAMQMKLLRVLQEGTFERIGGEASVTVDVRIVAATNEDLERASQDGRFRRDLFFRVNVFPIVIPPLRERIEDLEIIVDTILNRLEREGGKRIFRVAPDVLDSFRGYPWPGNIRELESLLERAYILEPGRELSAASFPPDLFFFLRSPAREGGRRSSLGTLGDIRRVAVDQAEATYLKQLLRACRGRTAEAAEVAGVTPRQLRNLLRRHGLKARSFQGDAEPGTQPPGHHSAVGS